MVAFYGEHGVIPPQGSRDILLNDQHETHPGASRMKTLVRSYFWWPHTERKEHVKPSDE